MKATFEVIRKIFGKDFQPGTQLTSYDTSGDFQQEIALPTDVTGAAVPSLGHSTFGSTGRLFPLYPWLTVPSSAHKAYSATIIPLYPILKNDFKHLTNNS